LEVQCLDAEGRYKGKEASETNQNCGNWTHEIRFETIMVFNISVDSEILSSSEHLKGIIYIVILRHNQSIHCPCYWTIPIIPYPPSWNFLKNAKIGKEKYQ